MVFRNTNKLPVHYHYLMNLNNLNVKELKGKKFIKNLRCQTDYYLCYSNYKPISDIDLHIKNE